MQRDKERSQWRTTKSNDFDLFVPFYHRSLLGQLVSHPKKASDRLEFQPSWDSMDQDLLSLYGQYQSTKVDHMDVEKAFYFVMNWKHLFSISIYLVHIFVSCVLGRNSRRKRGLESPPKISLKMMNK